MRIIAILAQWNSYGEMGQIMGPRFPVLRGLFSELRVEV